jgi:hypothetical protein
VSNLKVSNTSVANVYRRASFDSEVMTQAYLGEVLEVHENEGIWDLVTLEDGYQGWIDNYHTVPVLDDWQQGPRYTSDDPVVSIREAPDNEALVLRDLTMMSEMPLLDRTAGWVRLRLPDGTSGWIPDHPRKKIDQPDAEGIIATAMRFHGIQYHWGGRSPKGFDCSGFVQAVFALNGVQLPRDSYQQAELGVDLGADWRNWETGDLAFYSFHHNRVTHVGIVIGNGDIIHSSGYVRINSHRESAGDVFKPGFDAATVRGTRVLGEDLGSLNKVKQMEESDV